MSKLARRLFKGPLDYFARLEWKVDALRVALDKQGVAFMGQLEDLRTALDAATNQVAARFQKNFDDLQAALKAAGATPNPDTVAGIQADISRLQALGSDPANPIPVDPTTTP